MSDWPAETLVFRQVHPNHVDGVHPNSVAFFPTPKDKDQLSVDDSRLTTPEKAFLHLTVNLGYRSAGTWGVTVSEIMEAGDLLLESSPIANQPNPGHDNPAHCHIDFSGISSKGQKKKRAQTLAIKASERGGLYLPPSL